MSFGISNNRLPEIHQISQWDSKRVRSEPLERHSAKLPSPGEFVKKICVRRGLVSKSVVGTSLVERQCIQRAEEARQEYKQLRNDAIPITTTESLQPLQKPSTTC